MKNLPFKLKKNARDNEEVKVANLQAIAELLGGEWEVEVVDPVAFNEAIPNKDNLFTSCYKDILGSLKTNLVQLCEDELVKTSLSEALGSKKILIKLVDEIEPRKKHSGVCHDVRIEDGALVIHGTATRLICNSSHIGQYLEDELSLPFKLKKGERDSKAKKEENLKAIADALGGGEWSVEVEEPVEFYQSMEERARDSMYRYCYGDILGALVRNIVLLAEDDMVKEALEEAIEEKKIVIKKVEQLEQKHPGTYHDVLIKDGVLVVHCFANEKIICNSSNIGKYLEDEL